MRTRHIIQALLFNGCYVSIGEKEEEKASVMSLIVTT